MGAEFTFSPPPPVIQPIDVGYIVVEVVVRKRRHWAAPAECVRGVWSTPMSLRLAQRLRRELHENGYADRDFRIAIVKGYVR